VVAAGLCLIAAILAWPLLRADEPAAPARKDERVAGRPAVAKPPVPPARPAPLAPSTGAPEPATRPPATRTTSAPRSPTPSGAPGGEAEAKTGIAVFPPPGTDPPKAGIVVPDAYELPPGYVRHYQTTDDGQQLPPILMFHPDFQPVDDRGRPVPVPADRVVPPEMAPPGLPHDVLEVPPTHVPFVEDPPR